MSIIHRTARRRVRFLGAASVSAALALGVAGHAFASDIGQFSAAAECDGGKGIITVTAKDPAGTPALVSVYLENNGADARFVGEQEVRGSAEGVSVVFAEDWKPGAVYRIRVKAGAEVDEDIRPNLTAPDTACADDSEDPKPAPSQPAATISAHPTSQAPAPATPQTSIPPASADSVPSPATGDSHLAATGSSSNTGLIIGIAAVLVAVGVAAVFLGLRRRGTNDDR